VVTNLANNVSIAVTLVEHLAADVSDGDRNPKLLVGSACAVAARGSVVAAVAIESAAIFLMFMVGSFPTNTPGLGPFWPVT
jgi:hypothetical protein